MNERISEGVVERLFNELNRDEEGIALPRTQESFLNNLENLSELWTDGREIQLGIDRLQRAREKCMIYYLLDPIHNRRVESITSFIFSQGVQTKSLINNDLWQRNWHSLQIELLLRAFSNRIQVSGEAFLVVNYDGTVFEILELDPREITHIITEKGNYARVLGYRRQATLQGFDEDGNPLEPETIDRFYPVKEVLEDGSIRKILHFKTLSFPNHLRGYPDTLPMLRATARYNKALSLTIKLLEALSAYGWKRTITGATDEDLKKKRSERLAQGPREPGSEEIVNEYEDIEILARSGSIGSADSEIKRLLDNVITASGLPEVILTGDASNGSYASIAAQLRNSYSLQEYRMLWRHWITELHDTFMELAGLDRELNDKGYNTCSVEFPKQADDNMESIARAVCLLIDNGIISKKTASSILGFDEEKEENIEEE